MRRLLRSNLTSFWFTVFCTSEILNQVFGGRAGVLMVVANMEEKTFESWGLWIWHYDPAHTRTHINTCILKFTHTCLHTQTHTRTSVHTQTHTNNKTRLHTQPFVKLAINIDHMTIWKYDFIDVYPLNPHSNIQCVSLVLFAAIYLFLFH